LSGGKHFDPVEVQNRWGARWATEPPFDRDIDSPGETFYNLVEFPYPSAEGLHVGQVFTYGGADVHGRYQRMRGHRVLQPIGFDSFGIHTENFALRSGQHPANLTAKTIENFRRQLSRMGAAWNWERALTTHEPAYYRWTQWLFLRLFSSGLAYRAAAPVVWCPSCLTVLAREQLEGDLCERCGSEVGERVMEQWFLRITAYADRLVDGLESLDWPERAKRVQREWIGRSRGVEIDFAVEGTDERLIAFTTRADTLFGASFVAVAEGHGAVGRTVVHPLTGSRIPVVVAEHVVAGYGTGVVMGVPAHDARDWEHAMRQGLPILRVVGGNGSDGPWEADGVLVASGPFTGLDSATARERIADTLEERGLGRRSTRYRLHDWLISRQRYWGPPIPIIHCSECGPMPVPEADLPVLLPYVEDYRPTGTGFSPLAGAREWTHAPCPRCGSPSRRETDVSDTFLDSAWYFLRYPSVEFNDHPWDQQRTARWMPVDAYAGGPEHVARHHLYARFELLRISQKSFGRRSVASTRFTGSGGPWLVIAAQSV
jgi:leucyl-tRNA synthetase